MSTEVGKLRSLLIVGWALPTIATIHLTCQQSFENQEFQAVFPGKHNTSL
ncbi:MAG: hypothetical protein ACOC04_01460 [Halothece sp.]